MSIRHRSMSLFSASRPSLKRRRDESDSRPPSQELILLDSNTRLISLCLEPSLCSSASKAYPTTSKAPALDQRSNEDEGGENVDSGALKTNLGLQKRKSLADKTRSLLNRRQRAATVSAPYEQPEIVWFTNLDNRRPGTITLKQAAKRKDIVRRPEGFELEGRKRRRGGR